MRSFIREKKIYCGKQYREVDIFTYTDAQCRAVKRGTRSKKIKESEPKQKNLNDKNARRYFIQTANLNFGDDPDALHVTATYSTIMPTAGFSNATYRSISIRFSMNR